MLTSTPLKSFAANPFRLSLVADIAQKEASVSCCANLFACRESEPVCLYFQEFLEELWSVVVPSTGDAERGVHLGCNMGHPGFLLVLAVVTQPIPS